MVNNELNPQGPSYSQQDLEKFLTDARERGATSRSIVRGAGAMGFGADHVRRSMYDMSERQRELDLQRYSNDLRRMREQKDRLALENKRLQHLEDLKKKGLEEQDSTPGGDGSELSLSQRIIDADKEFLEQWERRQLLLDYKKAISENDNDYEVQRLQGEINNVFGVQLGFAKTGDIEETLNELRDISVAENVAREDDRDYFGKWGKGIAVGFGGIIDFINPASTLGSVGSFVTSAAKPLVADASDYEQNFEESNAFITEQLGLTNEKLGLAINNQNEINTELGYAPDFSTSSRAEMENLYEEILTRNFNTDVDAQNYQKEVARLRGTDPTYLGNMFRGLMDRSATAAVQALDATTQNFVDGGLSGIGLSELEGWADRGKTREAARRTLMLEDADDQAGIIESFVDGDIAKGLRKFGYASPDLISQGLLLAATKGKSRKAALGWLGVKSGGNYYAQIKDREDLTDQEKFVQAAIIGTTELALNKFFIGAENALRSGIKKVARPKNIVKAGKDNLDKALKDIRDGRLNVGKEFAKGFGSEALEEGLMNVIEQNLGTFYDIAEGKLTAKDAMDAWNPYELADSLLLGGMMGGGMRGIGALASNVGHSKIIKDLEKGRKDLRLAEEAYNNETNPVMKDVARMKMLEVQDDLMNLHSIAANMYGRFSVEDGEKVIAINQKLSKLRDQINGTEDSKVKQDLITEFKRLYSTKTEIESKYVTEDDIKDIEDRAPFDEQRLEEEEREARENGGQYKMTFPDESGKPQTVGERATKAQEAIINKKLNEAKSKQQKEEQAEADKRQQEKDSGTAPKDTEKQSTQKAPKAKQETLTSEGGEEIVITAEDLYGKPLASVTVSNVNGFLRGAKKAVGRSGVKVVLHKTQESFDASNPAAGETLGYFNPDTNEIHLRPDASLGTIREEFSHAILGHIIGPRGDATNRRRLYKEAVKIMGEKRAAEFDREYRKFYTDQLKNRTDMTEQQKADFVQAKIEEETIADVLKTRPKGREYNLAGLRRAINRIIASLYGKQFVIKSDDSLRDMAMKLQEGTRGKSNVDVEGAAPPPASASGTVTPALKDPIAGKEIFIKVNLRETRTGNLTERTDLKHRAFRFNDYRHFSNWYAKMTGNSNPDLYGRVTDMFYLDESGERVDVQAPAPLLNRDGSRKFVDPVESDRARYHRLRSENRRRRDSEAKSYRDIRSILTKAMQDYGIKGSVETMSGMGNTREGIMDTRKTVMDIIDRRGSRVDTAKVVRSLSRLETADGNIMFLDGQGYQVKPQGTGAPILLTSNSQQVPLDQLSADAVKAFADANAVVLQMADGVIGITVNGDVATLTMNHSVPSVYEANVISYAESMGMPSVYSTAQDQAVPVSNSQSYRGMGSPDAVIDAVAALKANKKPPSTTSKPMVSPAAGTTENVGTLSPSLKIVQDKAKNSSPDVSIGTNKSVLAMGKALVTKIGDKLINTVAEGYRGGISVADLRSDELIKRLDGCEFITVAYDQTGRTVVEIEGVKYDIRSGVRLAKDGEIMSHRNELTRDETARALEKAAAKAKANGKEIVVLYTGMESSGLKSNPFVARAIMQHSMKVAKDLGIMDDFLAAFSGSLNQLYQSGDLGVRFADSLSFYAFESGAFNEETGEFEITTAEQFEAIVDAVANPRGETSQADFEATFNARETIVDLLTNRSGKQGSKSVASKMTSPKTAEFLERTVDSSDVIGFADPALSNQGQKLAASGNVVAIQFVDPSLMVNPNGTRRMSWRKESFKTDKKNAFAYTIQGGTEIQFTSHHISLAEWAPDIMTGRSSSANVGTIAKGKQMGTLSTAPFSTLGKPADSEQAEIRMGVGITAGLKMPNSQSQNSGQFQQRDRTKFELAKDFVIRKLQNKFREIMVLQEDVEAFKGRLDESEDFGLKETLFYGKAANDLAILEERVNRLKSVMNQEGITSEDVGEYMYALHAKERNALIKKRDGVDNGSGMTDAEADAILNKLSPEQKAKLEKAAKVLRDIMQETRDTLRKFGLNTDEEVDGFESQFDNYIPLAGIAKDEQVDGSAYPTGGAGLAVYKSPVKKAKGRKYKAREVVAQVIAQAANTHIHARKNEALTALHNLIQNNPNPAVWSITGVADYGDKSVVPVRINGKKKYLKFTNAHYADSLNGMTVEKTNTFIKILRAPSNWLRRSFTTLDPEFVVSNFARDIQSAIFNATADAELDGNGMNGAEVRGRIMRSVFPLMKSLLRDAAGKNMKPEHRTFYEEFKADGGKTGWAYAKPLEEIASELKSDPESARKKVMGALNKVTDFIEGVNDAVENSIRLAAYIAARENGVSREKAAQFAKNITVNFNKSGEMGQVANAVYLFFNASVQGTARIAKSLTLKPKFKDNGEQRSWQERITGAQKLAMSLTLLNAMLALINEAMSDEDEDGRSFYSKISDYEKERNMIIMLGGRDYIKIPMPYGYNVFANMGTVVSEISTGTREIDDGLMFLLSSAFGSFSPISFGQSKDVYGMLEKGLAPTIAKPFIEVANNETFFGSRVYAEQFPGGTPKPDSQMSFRSPKWISDTFDFLNEVTGGSDFKSGWIDTNPDKGWYLFEYFLGGAGRFVTRSGELVRKAGNKAFVNGDVDLEFNDVPILRKMYGSASRYYDYDLFDSYSLEIGQSANEIKAGLFDSERHKGVMTLNAHLKAAKKQLKVLRSKRREARDIENYADRLVRLEELMEKERKIIMNFNKKYDELRKAN